MEIATIMGSMIPDEDVGPWEMPDLTLSHTCKGGSGSKFSNFLRMIWSVWLKSSAIFLLFAMCQLSLERHTGS